MTVCCAIGSNRIAQLPGKSSLAEEGDALALVLALALAKSATPCIFKKESSLLGNWMPLKDGFGTMHPLASTVKKPLGKSEQSVVTLPTMYDSLESSTTSTVLGSAASSSGDEEASGAAAAAAAASSAAAAEMEADDSEDGSTTAVVCCRSPVKGDTMEPQREHVAASSGSSSIHVMQSWLTKHLVTKDTSDEASNDLTPCAMK